jgi:hypothetical protein
MAGLFDAFDPVLLTGLARLILADEDRPQNMPRLNNWFPAQTVDSTDFKWDRGTTQTYTESAPFRTWDVPARLGTRPGRTIARGEMPPISIEYIQREFDILMARQLAAAGAEFSPEDVGLTAQQDIRRGIRAIFNRMWVVMGDLLMNGTSTITDQQMNLVLDSQRVAGRETTVGTVWSDTANAVPMTDEEAMLDTLQDEEGLGPQDLVVLTNRDTWREYKATDQVRNASPTVRVLDTLSVAAANEVRADNDFPEVVIIDAQVKPWGAATRKVITDGKWVFVPKNDVVGTTVYGTPAVVDLGIELAADDRPGPVAYVTTKVNPAKVELVVDAIGVPLLTNPDVTACLTV